MLAESTIRRLPSRSRRCSCGTTTLPAGHRRVPSGWRGKSAPVKRPAFQEVAVVGGAYPEAGAEEASEAGLVGAYSFGALRAGANSVVRTGKGGKLVPQLQSQVPAPLSHDLPGFLPPGRMATPSVRLLFLVFQSGFKGTAVQVERHHIRGSEGALW